MRENRAKEICEENILCLVDKNTRGKPKTVWIFYVTNATSEGRMNNILLNLNYISLRVINLQD